MSASSRHSSRLKWTSWEWTGVGLLLSIVMLGVISRSYNLPTVGRSIGFSLCGLFGIWSLVMWAMNRVRNPFPRTSCLLLGTVGFLGLWSLLYAIPLPAEWVLALSPPWRESIDLLMQLGLLDAAPDRLPLGVAASEATAAFHQGLAMLCVTAGCLVLASQARGTFFLGGMVVGLALLETLVGLAVSALGTAPRSHGVHLNSNHHAAAILMGMPVMLVWLLRRRRPVGDDGEYIEGSPHHRDQQIFFFCLGGAAMLAWLMASSRGSLAALAVVALVWAPVEWIARERRRARGSLGARMMPLAIVGALALLVTVFLIPAYRDRLADTEEAVARWSYWQATLRGLQEEAMLGVGPGGVFYSINRFLEGHASDLAPTWSHNDYVQLLGEFGVVGFGIVALLALASLVSMLMDARCLREQSARQRALWGAFVASAATVLIHAATDFHLRSPLFAIQFLCLLCLIVTHAQTYMFGTTGFERARESRREDNS